MTTPPTPATPTARYRAAIAWSAAYRPEWDDQPTAYFEQGLVGWGRSRRLGRLACPAVGLLVYVGVQHVDPLRWGRPGAPKSHFFISCRQGRQVWLRVFPTLDAGLQALPDPDDLGP